LKVFIDSNIPMYVAGAEHPNREPARRFLARVQAGEVEGYTSTEVLQEILYRYSALRRLDLAREVYDLFVQICPVVLDVTLADTDHARDLLLAVAGISARDAVHAAVMLNHQVEWIATFDAGFDHITGIQRLDLSSALISSSDRGKQ
jgi:predicted nucleic acid-binding protein